VFWLNTLSDDDFPFILNGFSINDTTVARFSQSNAELPMLVTLLGITTKVRPEQPLNAVSPMLVTLLPMLTEVRFLQI